MRNIILIFILFTVLLNASNDVSTKIVATLLEQLAGNKYTVWLDTQTKKNVITINEKHLHTRKHCKDASILLLYSNTSIDNKCKNKIIFVLDYALLHKYRNAVGAFYWKKGRPNIVFIRPRLEKHKIKLNKSYDKYIEDSLLW